MRTIEITTTQNVVIQYNPATLVERVLACVADFIVIGFGYFILLLIFNVILDFDESVSNQFAFLTLAFYSLIFERFMNGQTPGKRIVGIKVIKVDGGQPEGLEYFKRWSLRLLDVYLSLGSLALISVGSSEKGQRLGDKIADTLVIKIQNGTRYNLNEILKLTSSDGYKPQYPEAIQLDEWYVIQLKRLVGKQKKSDNAEMYEKLTMETAQQLEKALDITSNQAKPVLFLQQIIRDYVILTR